MEISEAKEICITIKNEEKRMTHKFLVYKEVEASIYDPLIREFLEEAKKNFGSEPESIKIKINLEL